VSEANKWREKYSADKQETIQVRLSSVQKQAIHNEAARLNIKINELIRLYADWLGDQE
jgi:hypothetical protein